MAKVITRTQEQRYLALRADGQSITEASKQARFSDDYARKHLEHLVSWDGETSLGSENLPGPKSKEQITGDARIALDDFEVFQRRYFGRIPIPWQTIAANELIGFQETGDREFVVMNAPPGAGKTALLHDIACWLTVRNRRLRGLYGSATQALAERNVNRLRRTLMRTTPVLANIEWKDKGLALDASGVLAQDYGRFQPIERDRWTRGEFVVMQAGQSITEKESTWTAFGADTEQIGGRYDVILWDDLVTKTNTRSVDQAQNLQEIWDDVSEARLEPGGLLLLFGQRLAADDLYRYCLDKTVSVDQDDEDDSDEEFAPGSRKPRYHHIVFQAHYDEKCAPGSHRRDAAPYPEGCLLSPRRLPMKDLRGIMDNSDQRFDVVYQQKDVEKKITLVDRAWVYGEDDHPGCLDHDRDRLQLPKGLSGDLFSIATADPSPSKFWAIEWWVFHPDSQQHFLMDLERRSMGAGDFLDWNYNEHVFSGLMEEWQQTSIKLGLPIQYWIVETNAAQKFLLQYDHVRRWLRVRSTEIKSHETHANKSDEKMGVTTVAPHWKFGRIRLPYKPSSDGRLGSLKLIEECVKYGSFRTDDCVMAHWFAEHWYPRLYDPQTDAHHARRPSWAIRTPQRKRRVA